MPDSLPIDALLPALCASLRAHPNAVVVAPPGSGKTTRVPAALLDAGLAGDGKVVVLQPRRVAARLAARRIAWERGGQVGEEVGYQVRFERRVGPKTRLEILTEGLLVRRLQEDPFLDGVGVVVLDELHERSQHVDLALALLRDLQRSGRDDLKLIAMSATLDPGPVARFLGDCPVFHAEGRVFPVRLVYDARPDDRPLAQRCAEAVESALRAEEAGHVLVFLPGVGEIRAVEERLSEAAARPGPVSEARVLPLHGSLPGEAQDRALAPSPQRKVVLATNVAETSVTLEGVTAVIDSGLARIPSFDPLLGLTRLSVQRISAAAADQRAGRAGRTAPGLCRRLWTLSQQAMLAPAETPELLRADLSRVALEVRGWGADPRALAWLDPLPEGPLGRAEALLQDLGALDGGLTALGRRLLALPLEPRLGRVVLEGHTLGCLSAAAAAAALASERDPWERADPDRLGFPRDLLARVEALLRGAPPAGVDRGAWRAALAVMEQLEGAAQAALGRAPDRGRDEQRLARALLAGFPDRVGRRRAPDSPRLRLVGGQGAALSERCDPGAGELLLAVVLEAGERRERAEARVRVAVSLERAWLPATALRTEESLIFDPQRQSVLLRRRLLYHDLPLEERDQPAEAGAPGVTARLAEAAARDPAAALSLDEEAERLLARVRFLRGHRPDLGLPDWSDPSALLPAACEGRRSFAELRALDWAAWLRQALGWAAAAELDRLAPDRFTLPTGSSARIDYRPEGPPVLAARIQQLFGLADTPRVGGAPVLLHLLAPNNRPVQVTQDLAGFWSGSYLEVRKDLRGRYPKHAWPDDPRRAPPQDRPRRPGA